MSVFQLVFFLCLCSFIETEEGGENIIDTLFRIQEHHIEDFGAEIQFSDSSEHLYDTAVININHLFDFYHYPIKISNGRWIK
jgi:hypothetical protein